MCTTDAQPAVAVRTDSAKDSRLHIGAAPSTIEAGREGRWPAARDGSLGDLVKPRQRRMAQVRAEDLAQMREMADMTQARSPRPWGSQQSVSAIESGSVADLRVFRNPRWFGPGATPDSAGCGNVRRNCVWRHRRAGWPRLTCGRDRNETPSTQVKAAPW